MPYGYFRSPPVLIGLKPYISFFQLYLAQIGGIGMTVFTVKIPSNETPSLGYGLSYILCWAAVICMLIGCFFAIGVACDSRLQVHSTTVLGCNDNRNSCDNNQFELEH